ncbi:MAG: hypothetical protein IJS69_06210 [Selenomonadaceae bacterium]|nr:hypothetical protein [Selenomonadaceae bacterium]
MKYVNVIDAKEQFTDLVTLLSSNPLEEVYLTFAGKPIIKMQPIKENLPLVPEEKNKPKIDRRRAFGIAKGTFVIDDELFDSMDAEIDKMFFGGEAK